jgi:pseudouridine-5'-phosphate glycosidase
MRIARLRGARASARAADPPVTVSAEVRAALAAGRPVVALESTLITHGLKAPLNLEVAMASEAAVRREGAVPATIAIRGGRLLVGLSAAELELLAAATGALKASRHNLAAALGSTRWAGTTVSATMIAAHLAGIRVLATGGIGGVHRGGATSMDISADLAELARTPVLVVCAGPKSILDAALTLEVLESHGVPVVGLATDELPGFFSRSSGLRLQIRAETPAQVAALAQRHWDLGLGGGIVVATPVPQAAALPAAEAARAIGRATADAEAGGIHGPAATPWILARVAELTEGRSTAANIALIEHDAEVGARIAAALAEAALG